MECLDSGDLGDIAGAEFVRTLASLVALQGGNSSDQMMPWAAGLTPSAQLAIFSEESLLS